MSYIATITTTRTVTSATTMTMTNDSIEEGYNVHISLLLYVTLNCFRGKTPLFLHSTSISVIKYTGLNQWYSYWTWSVLFLLNLISVILIGLDHCYS